MKLSKIHKYLGRLPKPIENQFIKLFQKSFTIQNTFRNELDQVKTISTHNPSLIFIAQGKNDIRYCVGDHIINSRYGKKIKSISTDKGSIILGLKDNIIKKDSPFLGSVYLLKGKKYQSFTSALNKSGLTTNISPVHKCGLGNALYKLIKTNRCGISVNVDTVKNLAAKSIHGLLIHVDRKSVNRFQSFVSSRNIESILLGKMIKESAVIINSGEKEVGFISVDILNIIENEIFYSDEIKMQISIPKDSEPKLKVKKNYNKDLKALLCNNKNNVETKILTKNGKHYGYASNDSDYIKFYDLKMSAIAAISNASRHLICAGIRPEIATGFLSIHEENTPEKGSFLSGIKSAGKHLNITLDHFAFESTKNQPSGSFFVMGRRIIDSDFPIDFQSPYQYISIIGSHRGELGGSNYLDLIKMNDWGRRPSVDLSMESRIQEVVLTAINGQLIQSARPIGKGGIATTIAKSFPKNTELGARIHFSTKLSMPELLFGETQGLIIVTINEEDLMEFERICMSIGVPSTTIGRLTDDGIYTFNDSIKIKVEKLINS